MDGPYRAALYFLGYHIHKTRKRGTSKTMSAQAVQKAIEVNPVHGAHASRDGLAAPGARADRTQRTQGLFSAPTMVCDCFFHRLHLGYHLRPDRDSNVGP